MEHSILHCCFSSFEQCAHVSSTTRTDTTHVQTATQQVSFHNEKAVRKLKVEKKVNEVLNRLEKTRSEVEKPDLEGEKEVSDQREEVIWREGVSRAHTIVQARLLQDLCAEQRGKTTSKRPPTHAEV